MKGNPKDAKSVAKAVARIRSVTGSSFATRVLLGWVDDIIKTIEAGRYGDARILRSSMMFVCGSDIMPEVDVLIRVAVKPTRRNAIKRKRG